MALTKVKPGGIHADLSSAISGSANASAISGSHTSGFEFAGTVSGSSISTGSFGRVEAAGDVELKAGNLFIGTAGKGIDFSATSDASGMTSELLDDYEEGTWTASVTDGTNAMTMNGSMDTGYYTKVGNLVTVSGLFITTSLGSASGGIRITGLPFTIANNYAAKAGGTAGYGGGFAITAGHSVAYYGEENSTIIYLNVWDHVEGITAMQASEWTADGGIIIGFSYRAA
jgi:hypothetical protein